MDCRHFPSFHEGDVYTSSSSLIVDGDIGEGAQLNIVGDLTVKGTVKRGAKLIATGNIDVYTAKGPSVLIKSTNGSIKIEHKIGQVSHDAAVSCFIVKETLQNDNYKFLGVYTLLQNNEIPENNEPIPLTHPVDFKKYGF